MTAPIDTSLTAEIWNQSIDDMLASFPNSNRLGGPGPFVINLGASTAPMELPAKSVAGSPALVYQVQRTEDRRQRYRLRLGPFATEDEAEAVLIKVRDTYPGALTATAEADDLRVIAAMRAKADVLPSPAEKSSESPAPPSEPVLAAGTPVAAVAPKPEAAPTLKPAAAATPKPAAAATPMPVAIPTLKPVAAVTPKPAAPPAPKLAAGHTTKPAAPPTLRTPVRITDPAGGALRMPQKAAGAPAARPVEEIGGHLPSLETTQTVRALTTLELEDDQASRWFVIQLSLAEEAFDPDTVPNLDIFNVYRLYSVAGIDQGRIVHTLRLGFFGEESAAGAVASYLAAFYDQPTIKRVSVAERQRFADQPLEPRKDVGATGRHAVIEITSERFVRERRNGGT